MARRAWHRVSRQRQIIGETPDGDPVEGVGIACEQLSARFLTLGARLNGLNFAGFSGLVPSFTIEEALGNEIVSGAVVAPVMNRLSFARAPLDGTVLEFDANHGPHLLHSGIGGTAGRVWRVDTLSENSVTFAITVAHMDGGFPGDREIRARFELGADTFAVELTATTDRPTLIAPGFHPYWTLSGRGRDGHHLQVMAAQYLPSHPDTIPTGEIAEVDGTSLDFRRPRAPGPDIDTCFVTNASGALRHVVRLESDALRLDVETDAPGVHVYTGHKGGIAIEPELWPDGPNKPGFPPFRLAPGETFRQITRHRFSRL